MTYRLRTSILALTLLAGFVQPAFAQEKKPVLFAVCVGISRHEHATFDNGVIFAAKDASDVAALLKSQHGKQFSHVECKLLTDGQATCRAVQDALTWLRETAGPESCVIVYLAGHAGPDEMGEYRFITHDSHPFLDSTHLSGRVLREGLEGIRGTRFLVLDTCHAGAATGPNADFVTIAGCTARQVSKEHGSLKNGFFTRAFLEALEGKADFNGDQVVTLAEVGLYLAERLRALTNGDQQLIVHRPTSIRDEFPLAIVPVGSAQPQSMPSLPMRRETNIIR